MSTSTANAGKDQVSPEKIFVTKMAVKSMGCKPHLAEGQDMKRLCMIYGRADGVKMGEDQNGKLWSALTGSFEGVNLTDGKMYRSGKLFLPSGIHETVENAVKELAGAEIKSGVSITFAMEIRSVPATNPIGYSYQAVNLMKIEKEDELDSLRRAINDHQKERIAAAAAQPAQIDAPKPAPQAQTPPAKKR